jgi:hypothetical protein
MVLRLARGRLKEHTMTKFANLIPGSMFSAPADADGVIYTVTSDRSVSADGMITMTADEAVAAFDGAALIVHAAPSVKSNYRPLPAGITVKA